jgi:hypothetical protein
VASSPRSTASDRRNTAPVRPFEVVGWPSVLFQRAGRRGGRFVGRKASDLVLLLGSRGKSRRRRSTFGGFANLGQRVLRWLGAASRSRQLMAPARRRPAGGSWLLLAIGLLCLGSGYFLGARFGTGPGAAGAGLQAETGQPARQPQAPEVLRDDMQTAPLSREAFFVAIYEGIDESTGHDKALRLGDYLKEQGFSKARAYSLPVEGQSLWCVVVYFDGDAERVQTKERLVALSEDQPCPYFVARRKSKGAHWPEVGPIR